MANKFIEAVETMTTAKKLLGSIIFMIASIVGGYNIVSDHFITKAYANEMVREVKTQFTQKMDELQKQTKSNSVILTEMRLIRLEAKLARGEELTPTEKRIYEKLKKQYEND